MKIPISMFAGFSRSREARNWTLFCFLILLLKVLLFALDPLPKFMMGDSGAYLRTALTEWIPEARSYFYGYVVRWSSVGPQSLTSLLILQLFLSTVVSILLAWICRFVFQLRSRWAYLLGLLGALDPLQLLYERCVMTEAISLFFYAVVLHLSFRYLRDRRLRDLVFLQAVSVLLIGFRMSYLPVVQLDTVILPLLAFSAEIRPLLGRRPKQSASPWPVLRLTGSHLLISVLLMFGLHTGYKRANGWISHRPPAYLHASGVTLLAFLSPILEPEDTSDPDLANLIQHGDELGLRDVHLRDNQRFSPGYLIDRFSRLHPERSGAERLAKEAALNALRRDPLGAAAIGWRIYADFWSAGAMRKSAEMDLSFTNLPGDDLIAVLASQFHLALHKGDQTKSPLQWYYVLAWPYYFLLLLAPFLAGVAIIFRSTRKYALLLFLHLSLVVALSVTFGGQSVRFYQPVSLGTLLVVALLAKGVHAKFFAIRGKMRHPGEIVS